MLLSGATRLRQEWAGDCESRPVRPSTSAQAPTLRANGDVSGNAPAQGERCPNFSGMTSSAAASLASTDDESGQADGLRLGSRSVRPSTSAQAPTLRANGDVSGNAPAQGKRYSCFRGETGEGSGNVRGFAHSRE